jgi:hypothetical protein
MDSQHNNLQTIAMANGDYAVIRLNAVNTPEPNQLVAATHAAKFNDFYQQAEISGYIKYLDTHAKIERRLSNTNIIQ